MNKICTSIEQSLKLIELGIDVKTADMCWCNENDVIAVPYNSACEIVKYAPAWSLSALLDIIPNWTMDKTDKINLTCNPYYHCEVCYNDYVDAAFEMICWLLKENNKTWKH